MNGVVITVHAKKITERDSGAHQYRKVSPRLRPLGAGFKPCVLVYNMPWNVDR